MAAALAASTFACSTPDADPGAPGGETTEQSLSAARCSSAEDCAAGSYCSLAAGQCSGNGRCQKRPEICSTLFDPVCGCDGRTHSNACEAARAGVSARQDGACGPPASAGPACGARRCAAGQVCCNASCGICTPPGGACIQIFCS
jgi:hypothetical protein